MYKKEEKNREGETNLINAILVCELLADEMVPALMTYVEVIESLKQIFNTLCTEIKGFLSKTEKIRNKNSQIKKRKAYFNCVKKMADRIINATVDVINFYGVCIDRIEGCLETVDKSFTLEKYYKEISGGNKIGLEGELKNIMKKEKYEKVFEILNQKEIEDESESEDEE